MSSHRNKRSAGVSEMKGVFFSKNGKVVVDAQGIYYRELNRLLLEILEKKGPEEIELRNITGQRYIGTSLKRPVHIDIFGTPGSDLGAFMNGPVIRVYGNAQDGCANTMNEGRIVIYGHAGDILGMSMRGGKVFVKDDIGYRGAIHMKEYKDKIPVVVIGGTAQDFLGEYMAGGVVILLDLNRGKESHKPHFIGTGMHGGRIFLRGDIEEHRLGKEVGVVEPDEDDRKVLEENIKEFCDYFGYDPSDILKEPFIKLYPKYLRPYGRLYAY